MDSIFDLAREKSERDRKTTGRSVGAMWYAPGPPFSPPSQMWYQSVVVCFKRRFYKEFGEYNSRDSGGGEASSGISALPDHWAELLHYGSVTGGESEKRGAAR